MNPRICHITSAHSPDDIRIFKKECSSLAKAGYDVHLIAPPKVELPSGVVTVHYLSKNRRRFSRMWSSVNEVVGIIDSIKPSVVHLHDPELLRIVPDFKSRNIRVIYDAHEDLPKQIATKSYIPKILRPLVGSSVNSYMRKRLKSCAAIVAATPHIAAQLKGVGSLVYTVCNYPILDQVDLKEPTASNRRICYIGSITESRGIFQMLDAVSFMEDVAFDLVGPFASASLEEACKRHPNWQKVNFHGPLYGHDAARIMREASIGLVLLQPFPSYKMSLPVKMFEYMNNALPVLASNFELWNSILSESSAGVCVDSTNPKAIGEAVNNMLADQDKLNQMGMSGRKVVENRFNWGNEVGELLRLYEKLNLPR